MLTFDLFGLIGRARIFKGKEWDLMFALGIHISENKDGETWCTSGYWNLSDTSGIGSFSTLSKAIAMVEAMGVIKVVRSGNGGRSANTYYLNELFLETTRRELMDLKNRLRDEEGLKGRELSKTFRSSVVELQKRLYEKGVPEHLVPADWRRAGRGPNPEELRKLQNSPKTTTPGVAQEGPGTTPGVAQKCGKDALEDASSATLEGPCTTLESRSTTPRECSRTKEPRTKTPVEREKRQKLGEGAFDRPGRVQEAFEIMLVHWVATGKWSAPGGYNGDIGPPPDDITQASGFGLGPKRLSGVITRLIIPLERKQPPYLPGSLHKLGNNAVTALQRDPDGVRERMEAVRTLRDQVTELNHQGRWTPPPVPVPEPEVA